MNPVKKIKGILFLVSVCLGILFSPGLVMAGGPNDCCKLDHNLTEIDPLCTKDTIVGPKDWNPAKHRCEIEGATTTPDATTINWSKCCIVDTIYNITDWIFYVLLSGIAIVFILGAFFFLTASGDPNKVKQAQNFLLYGGIGLLLALMARIIPAIIKSFVS